MIFFVKLLFMVTFGFVLGLIAGLALDSPALGILAFLLWCVSRRKGVFQDFRPEEEE